MPGEISSDNEMDWLSGEMNQKKTQELNPLMNIVYSQLQSATSEAINEQILLQLQPSLTSLNEWPP